MREERVYMGHITEFQNKKYYFKGTKFYLFRLHNMVGFLLENQLLLQ